MIVPKFWAEARLQEQREKRRFTIRRYGWSDVSEEDAQRVAEERAREAMARAIAGEPIERREKKTSYGVEGVPIREEVVAWHGESVVTRNIYGARCLNTPSAFFIDVDFRSDLGRAGCVSFFVGFAAPFVVLFWYVPFWKALAAALPVAFGALIVGGICAVVVSKVVMALRGGAERVARRRIEAYFAKHELWRWRLYRTPFGYRVLVMHRPFDPEETEVDETFKALGADPLYALMCRKQRCFRARVSPKPWRIGVGRILPRNNVWPIRPEGLPARQAWVEKYEHVAEGYAACRFEGEFGEGIPDSGVAAVQRLHDQLSRAESGLTIA